MEFSDNPSGSKGIFHLLYEKLLIGSLMYDGKNWSFKYSDEFKNDIRVNTIIDFPDIEKEYIIKELWPFNATRIPSLNQPYQLKKIQKANIDENDSVELLKLFGNDTITNPFRVTPA
jgi:HipA-like protein